MYKNQIFYRKSGFPGLFWKSKRTCNVGAGRALSILPQCPGTHLASLIRHGVSEKNEASPRGSSVTDCLTHQLLLYAQITGCIKTELSSSWAASPSSLKRFSGLPMVYPTPSALQTTSACWPASGWKSPPRDGAPRGRELLFQKSPPDPRRELSHASGNLDPRNFHPLPSPSLFPFPRG